MPEGGTDNPVILWSVPQCPFTIEASARVLDDIRLAITDAFFSLPRGGAEIGGVLLGKFDGAKVTISDYAALDCEHAFGPSFVLSPADEARLSSLIAAHDGFAGGPRAVGWYHSHTRSEIFLSEADLAAHERFFPEQWQVALVLKPHTFQPTRYGYFFRQEDGSVHASASYREEQLEALPLRQVPAGPPLPAGPPSHETGGPQLHRTRPTPMFGPVVDIPSESAPVASPAGIASAGGQAAAAAMIAKDEDAPIEESAPLDIPVPRFAVESASSARRWMTLGIAIVGGLGICAAAYKTKDLWMPRLMTAVRPAQAAAPAVTTTVGLTTLDRDGQLQISWDRNVPGLRDAAYGMLEIQESGAVPTAIQLDGASLQTGAFTYARTTDKVDIKLTVHRKDAAELRGSASFLGKMPDHKAEEEAAAAKEREAEAIKQRDDLAQQAARMKADLNSQAAKTKKLEKDMEAIREEMHREQQRRMTNQAPGK
ncbi:MAG: hypothetical protein ABI759_22550 [Candidatus Solibacter sp.]